MLIDQNTDAKTVASLRFPAAAATPIPNSLAQFDTRRLLRFAWHNLHTLLSCPSNYEKDDTPLLQGPLSSFTLCHRKRDR